MPSSKILIASNTLTSNTTTVTFSSIPNTYTDLVLKIIARCDLSNSAKDVYVQPNSASSSLSMRWLYGYGTTVASSSDTKIWLARIAGANSTANSFSSAELYIPNYAGSANKPMSSFGVYENNSASDNFIGTSAGLWSSTSSITSLLIDISNDNFVSGSSFFLYGISSS